MAFRKTADYPTSSYNYCSCRDCPEIVITDDATPVMCGHCVAAGCNKKVEIALGDSTECQRTRS